MKKINLLLLISLLILTLLTVSCLSSGYAVEKDPFEAEFEGILNGFKDRLKTVKDQKTYNVVLLEKDKEMTDLQKKIETAKAKKPLSENQIMVYGKVLSQLRLFDQAYKQFELLISKKSPLTNLVKFELAKIMLQQARVNEAAGYFGEIENKLEKNDDYMMVLFAVAASSSNPAKKIDYSQKFIDLTAKKPEMLPYRIQCYDNMANAEKERGNLPKSIQLLEKAITLSKVPQEKKQLENTLKQFKLLNQPAPEISAETWFNSSPIKLSALKGKAVIIDFWATWCTPCRILMPTLQECYHLFKDKGLVVIGFTRIQGFYTDDKEDKGKVSADEEKRLTKDYVTRLDVKYPIAIANGRNAFDTYGVGALPTMVLIDRKGNIRDFRIGWEKKEALEERIRKLIDLN
ncbi:MAG: redoxin domain-containing protein [Candidatus Omnitrophota bacterium]